MKNIEGRRGLAKRSLGQNFLIAPKVAEKIASLASACNAKTVLEVGPGKGMLTRALLRRFDKVIAIEKDDTLYESLRTTFREEISNERLLLIHGDAVAMLTNTNNNISPPLLGEGWGGVTNPEKSDAKPKTTSLPKTNYSIASNIPYNITGELLRLFLSLNPLPQSITLMVQKEVGERIVAKDGKESILSLSVKLFGEPKLCGTIPRKLFRPIPHVDSTILHIQNIQKPSPHKTPFHTRLPFAKGSLVWSEGKFFEVVKAGFSQKRKYLVSNLSKKYPKDQVLATFAELGISPTTRAENLTLDDWIKLVSKLN